MSRKWRLKSGSDAFVLVRRVDLFPEELPTCDPALLIASLDGWLKDPLTRPVVIDIDEVMHGRVRPMMSHTGDEAVAWQSGVKTRVADAFKRRTVVGLLVARDFLTQAPREEPDGPDKPPGGDPPPPPKKTKQTSWIEVELLDEEKKPIANQLYRVEVPDGTFREGKLDAQGRVRIDNIDPGTCEIFFPDLEESKWKRRK